MIGTLAVYDITARFLTVDPKHRSWQLSLPISVILSVLGLIHTIMWFRTMNTQTTVLSLNSVYLFQSYMIVELTNELIFNYRNISILETVIHHLTYIALAVHVIHNSYSGKCAFMLIYEVPTFIRTLGTLYPTYRSDRLFGISYGILRVVWPFIYVWHIDLPVAYYVPFVLIQIMHIHWMRLWLLKNSSR